MSNPLPERSEHWTAHFSRPIIFIILTLVGMGIYYAFNIPVAVFPSTDFPRIVVGVDNGVAPINQMQVTVTRPIEEAMNSVPGLEGVRSVTSRGSAEINLFFNWNVDMVQTLQYVNAALGRVQAALPPTAKLTANRKTFAVQNPIVAYSLSSDTMPQTELWELANYTIKPRLNRNVPGVSMVVLQGGQVPEFEIEPDPAKLAEAQVTVPGILDAVAKTNMIDSPGLIENNHELSLTLVSGQTTNPEEIENIVVRTTPNGVPVRVGDVAEVHPSVMPVYTIVTANGKPSVLLNIFRQPEGNTVTVAEAASAEMARIQPTLPPGVKIQTFYDQSVLVKDSIASVRDAILIGLILAAVILVLFLQDWGSSVVAALVIPATIAITLIALQAMGQSLNLMTLGGLAAAVGLVIDDAIVVVENIVLHRDSGQSRAEAIRSALREIRIPLVGSTVTPIVVFLPLITMTGFESTFFRALALTVGMALLTSLALALTWTPTLSHYLLRRKAASAVAVDETGRDGGGARASGVGVDGEGDEILRIVDSICAGASAGVDGGVRGAGRGVVFLLPGAGAGFTAGDGRGRVHSRLPDAGGIVAGGHEQGAAGGRKDFAVDAGGGHDVAANGIAARAGGGDGGEPGRFLGAAEAGAGARDRRDYFRCAGEGEG